MSDPTPPGRPPPVDEHELHALVDGQLDPARLATVIAHLQATPEDAVRVASWQAQRLQLRRAARALELRPDLAEVPPALSGVVLRHATSAKRRRQAWQSAAAVLLLAAGSLAGLAAGRAIAPGSAADALLARLLPRHDGAGGARLADGSPAFVRDAVAAHVVYVPEKRHPVEVAASDEAHLVQWLGRRLGAPLKAPVLLDQGFRLLGGRLLSARLPATAASPGGAAAGRASGASAGSAAASASAAPRAQFMYEDASGRRVTLYLSAFAEGTGVPTAFRSLRDGPRETFYWTDDRLGYALSGELPSSELQALAREAYTQMTR